MFHLQHKTVAAITVALLSLPLMSGAQAKEAKPVTTVHKADLQHHPHAFHDDTEGGCNLPQLPHGAGGRAGLSRLQWRLSSGEFESSGKRDRDKNPRAFGAGVLGARVCAAQGHFSVWLLAPVQLPKNFSHPRE